MNMLRMLNQVLRRFVITHNNTTNIVSSMISHNLLRITLLSGLSICLLLSSCQSPNIFTSQEHISKTVTNSTINTTLRKQGAMQLQTLHSWISLMQQYGGDIHTYQQQYTTDMHALRQAKTSAEYKTALHQTIIHINAIKIPALKTESSKLQQNLQKQVDNWKTVHTFNDTYNNTTYHLGFEYDSNTGIGTWVQADLNTAKTVADYQQIIENLNMYLINFKAMETNTYDRTPYDQIHQTDLQLIKTYDKLNQKVLVISLSEQAMRVYDHGNLVRAFLVTTGQPDKPSPPGNWWVESHQKNVIFKANVPKSDPYWYPNTPINFAMQFHSNGYYIHDSWWRVEYGPYTQFPHQDVTGDKYADIGSHGCVNMSKADADWIYHYVELFTGVIIY
jgi:L,D-transpeptidase catalytic domain